MKRNFIEDGYEWVLYRQENDYVLAKDSNGLEAYDVPKDWEECLYSYDEVETYYEENPDKHFNFPEPTERELLIEELNSLMSWFTTYDEKCMQYQRSLRLGTQWEEDIATWDAKAVTHAARIKEIREILG